MYVYAIVLHRYVSIVQHFGQQLLCKMCFKNKIALLSESLDICAGKQDQTLSSERHSNSCVHILVFLSTDIMFLFCIMNEK